MTTSPRRAATRLEISTFTLEILEAYRARLEAYHQRFHPDGSIAREGVSANLALLIAIENAKDNLEEREKRAERLEQITGEPTSRTTSPVPQEDATPAGTRPGG